MVKYFLQFYNNHICKETILYGRSFHRKLGNVKCSFCINKEVLMCVECRYWCYEAVMAVSLGSHDVVISVGDPQVQSAPSVPLIILSPPPDLTSWPGPGSDNTILFYKYNTSWRCISQWYCWVLLQWITVSNLMTGTSEYFPLQFDFWETLWDFKIF